MSIDSKVEKLIRPEIRTLSAYHVPDPTGLIKLDAMENPYSWPESDREAWLAALRAVALNRYPDPEARALRARLRAALGVPAGQELILGNGSDELIQIILLALAKPGSVVLAPTPTFVMYQMIAGFVGMTFTGVPLTPDFALDPAAMQAAIARSKPAVVFLSYPNNPTGNLFARADVVRVIEATPGLVVIDEAYHAFAGDSFLEQLGRYDNLLVLRTLSKQGLAGLRLGLLAGAPAWLAEFNKVRLPYNIGSLTQASAEFALQRLGLMEEQARAIRAERERLHASLASIPGLRVWPSRTNFLLFRVSSGQAGRVFEELRRRGILIKNLHGAGPALADCLRVTVGTPEENAAFLAALKAVL